MHIIQHMFTSVLLINESRKISLWNNISVFKFCEGEANEILLMMKISQITVLIDTKAQNFVDTKFWAVCNHWTGLLDYWTVWFCLKGKAKDYHVMMSVHNTNQPNCVLMSLQLHIVIKS